MRSKTMLACLMASALTLGLVACSDDDSGQNNNNQIDLCGNGAVDLGEECDGTNLNGADCTSQGLDGGELVCTTQCTFDLTGCTGCGNGQIDVGELCDGANLDGATCADAGAFNGGSLACNTTCDDYNTSACTSGCPIPATDVTANVGSTITVTNTGETDDFTGSCSEADAPDVLLSFVAPSTATYIISTVSSNTDFDTLLFAFTDCMSPSNTEIACNDDVNDDYQSTIVVSADAGETVYIVVDGYDSEYGVGTAEVSIVEVNCTDDANEDDDNETTATALSGSFPITGGGMLCPDDISPEYEMVLDFYTLTVPSDVVIDAAIEAGAVTDCTQQELFVEFYDLTMQDYLGGASSNGTDCPLAVSSIDASGTDVIMVIGSTGATFNQDYNFSLTTRVPICGDGVVDFDEECDDGNTTAGDGCENDCTVTTP